MITSQLSDSVKLVDVQVNGAQKVDLSDPDLRLDDVEQYCRAMDEFGVQFHVPTIITCSFDTMRRNAELIAVASEEPWGKGILGIHLEGPYLDPECHGAHPVELVRPPSKDEFDRIFDAAKGKILWTTMSPRSLDGESPILRTSYIHHVREKGVVVSIGHHAAHRDEIEAAFVAGATGHTHLGNAMSKAPHTFKDTAPLLTIFNHVAPRSPESQGVTIMLVPDGEHVSRDFIKEVFLLTNALNSMGFVITSDQSPLAGVEPGVYHTFGGQEFKVGPSEANPQFLRSYPLSGSYLDLRTATQWLLDQQIIPSDKVIRAATINPLTFLQAPLQRLGVYEPISLEVGESIKS